MIACDVCRDVRKKAGEFRVSLAKVVPGAQRASQVTVGSGTVELCDECAAELFEKIKTVLPNESVRREEQT